MIRTRRNPYLDPQTKEKAREKARRDAQQLDEAVPRFSEEESKDRAMADTDNEGVENGEFDEADYLPDAQEIRFDYDEDAAAVRESDAKDGQGEGEDARLSRMEMQREKEMTAAAAQARAAAKVKPFVAADSPMGNATFDLPAFARRPACAKLQLTHCGTVLCQPAHMSSTPSSELARLLLRRCSFSVHFSVVSGGHRVTAPYWRLQRSLLCFAVQT